MLGWVYLLNSELLLVILLYSIQLLGLNHYFGLSEFCYDHSVILELNNIRLFHSDTDVSVVNVQSIDSVEHLLIYDGLLELDVLFMIESDLSHSFRPK